jgi:hypothetical protein
MKIAKGVLFAIAGLFLMVTLFSLLMPSRVVTTRAMVIQAPKKNIVSALQDLNQWKTWNPLFSGDSSTIMLSNPSSGIGAYIQWGKQQKNKFTITENLPEGVRFTLSRDGELPIENSIVALALQDSTGYQVEWTAVTKLKWYPWEKFAGIFTGEITGPGYESALAGLRDYAEHPKL